MSSPLTVSPPPLLPIISVVGPTGSGKSSCCDAVARAAKSWRVAGRPVVPHIFNVDVMQMLDGLPIGTNKPTAAERATAVHHFVGANAVTPGAASAAPTVGAFVLDLVDQVSAARASEWQRGNLLLPILCGGTHYYQLAALVCNAACGEGGATADQEGAMDAPPAASAAALPQSLDTPAASPAADNGDAGRDTPDNGAALAELRRLRPDLAARWHPNDTRRIQSCLRRVLAEKAAPPPPTLRQFAATDSNSGAEPPPVVVWVDCTQRDVLYDRINRRVSQMVDAGLLEEVAAHLMVRAAPVGEPLHVATPSELRAAAAAGETSASGVESAIGYKELCVAVAEALIAHSGPGLPPNAATLPAVAASLERLRAATRQYAKQQQQWLRRRFCALLPQLGVTFVRLPHDRAADLGVRIVEAALSVDEAHQPLAEVVAPWLVSALGTDTLSATPQLHTCDLCTVSVVGEAQWAAHMASSRHRMSVRRESQAANVHSRRREREAAAAAAAAVTAASETPATDVPSTD